MDFENVDVEFPIESPPSKRPKLDDPDTTTITTDSEGSYEAEENFMYVRDYIDPAVYAASDPMLCFSGSRFAHGMRCIICNKIGVGHIGATCPEKSRYGLMWCSKCRGTCRKDADHSNYHVKKLMLCDGCGALGEHWTNRCPKVAEMGKSDDDFDKGEIIAYDTDDDGLVF